MLAVCEKHGLEFEKKQIIGSIYTKCPICNQESLKARGLQEAKELREQEEAKEAYFRDYITKFSKIPQRYLNKEFDLSRFEKYSNYLKGDLKNNLFLVGDVGCGKTTFLSILLQKNKHRYPLYLNCNELIFLQNTDYRVLEFLNKLDGKGIVGIDEAQLLFLNNRVPILDAIIDKLYNQESIIVLSGNFKNYSLEFLNKPEYARMASRLREGGARILKFVGADLRKN